MTQLENSRHEAGADILASPDDLDVVLAVRLRERPGTRWMVEMHPTTRREFDLEGFNERFRLYDVRVYASRYVAPGEYRLLQRGFGTGLGTGPDETDRGPASSA